jgi:PIN domain nuclease of toxin-antitoxin system
VTVLDASALLAFVAGERGAAKVEAALESGDARCSAANWAEVAQKIRASGRDWSLVRALLLSYGLAVEPVTFDDAEWSAARWRRGEGLSLGDRLCLALGERLDARVLTADRSRGSAGRITQIRR